MLLKPFVINSHGRIVFPGNFFPELDFSVFKTLKQFAAVIRRDFGEKAPTEVEIVARVQAGEYKSRYELCRDLVLNRFWVNRYTLTMYEKRPSRWGDLPRQREDIFLPVYKQENILALPREVAPATGTFLVHRQGVAIYPEAVQHQVAAQLITALVFTRLHAR